MGTKWVFLHIQLQLLNLVQSNYIEDISFRFVFYIIKI